MKFLALALGAALAAGCQPMMKKALTSANAGYLRLPDAAEMAIDVAPVGAHTYTFANHFDRGLFVVTDEGIVVVDPFDKNVAGALRRHLDTAFPGKRVAALIYSHYHLDHVRGGAALEPREVIGSAACTAYWQDLDAPDVLPLTKGITGDLSVTTGGVEIKLIALPRGHTDTNLAVLVPADKVLYAADMGFVKAFPPYGMPDTYRPGQVRGLKQLAALDFDHFVPSHFGVGTKADLNANVEFYEESQLLARRLIRAHEGFPPPTKGEFKEVVDGLYDGLKGKYGDWYGFDAQAMQMVLRNAIGEGLGY